MTNFSYLHDEPQFVSFADAAVAAERTLDIDAATSVMACRRTLETTIKWIYSVDDSLELPPQDKLAAFMGTQCFQELVGTKLWDRLSFLRKMGNCATHRKEKISRDLAVLCLKILFDFMDFVSLCYSKQYRSGREFQEALCTPFPKERALKDEVPLPKLEELLQEKAQLKEELSRYRAETRKLYVEHKLELSDFTTRKLYIDSLLLEAGWTEGRDWRSEVKLEARSGKAKYSADYVLYDSDGRALALIEAKKSCKSLSKGRKQAELYAELLKKKFGRKPVIFLSNGFETYINDGISPERQLSSLYSKRDLQKLFVLRETRESLKSVSIESDIAGRYYQEQAIKAVCEDFELNKRRKALLVMATGSGKTRTVIALCKILVEKMWVKNILFLADRTALIVQAKRSFTNLLPSLSTVNLVENKKDLTARCVFSTYNTLLSCIDELRDEDGRLFSCGHFDLIICDEAHRSIYNRYREIFTYFDAFLLGLTATPKDEIDRNTYEVFELYDKVPTYAYELAQAVKDGYLVPFKVYEGQLRFLERGIVYDELPEEEKKLYEETFVREDGSLPEKIESRALNSLVFNNDTIREVLNVLMEHGLRVEYGEKIGKTIIFAKNHMHAERILAVFNEEYPELAGQAQVIDNRTRYAQECIDSFSDSSRNPQIAISVDMLDTGIDVPEVLNLVFFRKVMSKAKFWQMIGRGTRCCAGLIDGLDKQSFSIFDFCKNFEFFRTHAEKPERERGMTLQASLFSIKLEMVYYLQESKVQTDETRAFRSKLVEDCLEKVQALNKGSFIVRQHREIVELYSRPGVYQPLSLEAMRDAQEELAPLIHPDKDTVDAVRFDCLVYQLELALLKELSFAKGIEDLKRMARDLESLLDTIPEVAVKADLIHDILHTDLVKQTDFLGLERIRLQMRSLIKYVKKQRQIYDTSFTDGILRSNWIERVELPSQNKYKEKVEDYIRKHQGEGGIAKLHQNKPLSMAEFKELEEIVLKKLGSEEEYFQEYGEKPLGELVREIVGLDMAAAKEAFSKFLEDSSMNSMQIHFVNLIVEYIIKNGMLINNEVLLQSPFKDIGSVSSLFGNNWHTIQAVLNQIHHNAIAIAV